MPRTLIRHADCVLPDGVRRIDVLIEDDRIADLDPPRTAHVDDVVDAGGLHLLPGVIDDQVHFRDPGLTHKEDLHTGSLACAKGGVTTFL
jgi:dihydroorotase